MKSFMSVIKENRANFRKRLVNERAAIEMQIRDEGKKYCPNIADTVENCDVTSAKVGNIASQKKKKFGNYSTLLFRKIASMLLNDCIAIEFVRRY